MTIRHDQERLVRRFQRQGEVAVQRGSLLYEALLRSCAADLDAGGPTWLLLGERASEPAGDALPLRLLAAVHSLILTGNAEQLARYYPSVGGRGPAAQAWPALREMLREQSGLVRGLLDRPLQTNEVGRSVPIVIGLAWASATTGLPPAVLEIGTSAGLNLNWHRYRYQDGIDGWGPADSPVRLPLPTGMKPLPASLSADESAGCDRFPLDVTYPADRLWLRSCIWADQLDRLTLFDAAVEVAVRHPPPVHRGDAISWLRRKMETPRPGRVTVVVQTIVQQYLSPADREALVVLLAEAGERASAHAPLVWLRLEPPVRGSGPLMGQEGLAELRLRRWPPGSEHLLGYAGVHGQPIQLLTG